LVKGGAGLQYINWQTNNEKYKYFSKERF